MNKQTGRIAYASAFVTFLMDKLGDKLLSVDKIILYGSVAKGESTDESDVDIFVDTKNNIEPIVKEILDEFYESREAVLFKAKGIDNEINVKVGELKKWKELHRSIMSTGMVLWGCFEAKEKPIGSKHKIIFFWEKVRKNRTAFLNKLYGFETKERRHVGLLEEWNGRKIGKSCVMIPIKFREKMIKLLKKYDVVAKSIEVFALE